MGSGRHVVVVGGGISGLAAAHALAALSPAPEVTLIEAADRLGGKLALGETGGILLDTGAESVITRRPEGVDLVRAVGLGPDLVHPAVAGAQLLIEGTLRRLPRRQLMGIPYDLHELAAAGVLSLPGLLRIPLDRVLPRTAVGDDVAIGRYVAERLGQEVVDRLVEPLLGGVYAGHADELSLSATLPALLPAVRRHRSLLAAVAETRDSTPTPDGPLFASVRGGLGRLPGAVAVASGARVVVGAVVDALTRTSSGWMVSAGDRSWDADALVLALPAHRLVPLLEPLEPEAAEELRAVEYASVALVSYVFHRSVRDALPPGTGFLVPPAEERVVKAVTFSSQKWGWLAADHPDRIVLRASVGRHRDRADLDRDDDDLAWAALGEVATATGLSDAPLARSVTRWDQALPQYPVGHPGLVRRVRRALAGHRGLTVCGAWLDGVGVASCIASGEAAAARVAGVLGARSQ